MRRVLDLGCGNGGVFQGLIRAGFRGHYVGLDASLPLLILAEKATKEYEIPAGSSAKFLRADLSQPDWAQDLNGTFDFIFAFAVLHHLPPPLYPELLITTRSLFGKSPPKGGQMVLSNWQFLKSPRWIKRVLPWETIGIKAGEVTKNDYLLDWRRGGRGLRYVHYFEEEELGSLARKAGFKVAESFSADGKEGNLGLYQTWVPLI